MIYGFKILTQLVESNVFHMYVFCLKEYIFWTKVANEISTFWTFHCLSEFVQIPHVIFGTSEFVQIPHAIFGTRSQFLYKLCTILKYLS